MFVAVLDKLRTHATSDTCQPKINHQSASHPDHLLHKVTTLLYVNQLIDRMNAYVFGLYSVNDELGVGVGVLGFVDLVDGDRTEGVVALGLDRPDWWVQIDRVGV